GFSLRTSVGQPTKIRVSRMIPIVSVCEALQDRDQYNTKSIIVVGRFSHTREGSWLNEECIQRIVTNGFVWPNDISTTYVRTQVDPPPEPPVDFRWDDALLGMKLKEVQKTTKLVVRRQDNYSDKWVAMFGRFETRLPGRILPGSDPLSFGFGHLNGSPAQLI